MLPELGEALGTSEVSVNDGAWRRNGVEALSQSGKAALTVIKRGQLWTSTEQE